MADAEVRGRGLILSFEYTDLDFLPRENRQVRQALETVGFDVEEVHMEDLWYKFEDELVCFLEDEEDTPRFIYVNGHGGERSKELVLCRVGGQPFYEEIKWKRIQDIVAEAECHVLVVLDCCYAGLAEIDNSEEIWAYSKELFTATCWDTSTADRLAPALCKALKIWNNDSISLSAASLFQRLTAELRQMRTKADESALEGIEVLKKMQRRAEKQLTKSRKNKHDLRIKVLDTRMTMNLLDQEIANQEFKVEELKQKITSAERSRESSQGLYRQPHHLIAPSPTVPSFGGWILRSGKRKV